jgi:plastocyanin
MFQATRWSRWAVAAGLLSLSACGGGGSSPTSPSPMAKTVTVQIVDFAFNPKDVTVNPGDTVQWVLNSTTYTHTVTAENGSFNSGMMFTKPGVTFSQTFNTPGLTFQYHCMTHWHTNGMQGSIQVGDTAPKPGPGY